MANKEQPKPEVKQAEGGAINPFTQEFKEWMKEYVEKDNRAMELKSQLSDIKERKKELEEKILKYMKDNELNVFNIPNGGIFRRKKSKKTKGLNQTFLADCLEKSEKLVDGADVSELVKFIYGLRPTEEVEELDRKKA